MTVVISNRTLAELDTGWWPLSSGGVTLYDQYVYDYATLYRSQPNVRTCVDFLARNIAQLGLHVYRRVSDTDRQRLTDHPLAQVLGRPLPNEYKVTRYRLIEALVSDLGIYFNAFWLKIRVEDAPAGLLRVPPALVTVYGGLVPSYYEVSLDGEARRIEASEMVHVRGYSPDSAISGLSPLETLRRVLAEEHAAGDYREYFWRNAARAGGFIERPAAAPEWSEAARARFKAEFEALYAGGENSGKTAILEEGMTWKEGSFNPQESEYLAGRKLTREECARAYHIPPPLVGILDHATFSNIREQHKSLYSDTLGPWLALIEQDVMLQLMPEFDDVEDVYVEFNIAEKLQGDFEEQSKALQTAVGRPWMTANEARGVMNLPHMEGDADALVTPLNVLVGGQANPQDSAPPPIPPKGAKASGQGVLDSHSPELRLQHEKKWVWALSRHYRRQEAAVLSRLPAELPKGDLGGIWWDEERWNRELYEDLLRLNVLTAGVWAGEFAAALGAEVSEERMLPWLQEHSRIQAAYLNGQVRDGLEEALRSPEARAAVKDLFILAVSAWAQRQAVSGVTSAASFGANEAAQAGGVQWKRWKVNSTDPRDAHLAMDGERVPIRERFSNGMRWPGDPAGGAENNANCQCSVVFGR